MISEVPSADIIVKSFLMQQELAFRRLDELREKVSLYLETLSSNGN